MPAAPMARIKLWSPDVQSLNDVAQKIVGIAKKMGVEVRGPIPLPTKRLVVATLRLPHGEGSKVWDKWELRIHSRLILVRLDERLMRELMRIRVPENVHIEIKVPRVRAR